MSHYIQQLKTAQEADRQREADRTILKASNEAAAAREAMTPLHVRLARLLATVEAEVQRGGLSLEGLQPKLRGRRGGACQTGELGTALRRLGWTRTRRWRGGAGGGFSSLWFPPDPV